MALLSRWIQHLSVASDPSASLRRALQAFRERQDPAEQLALVQRCLQQGADPNRTGASEVPVLSMAIDHAMDSRHTLGSDAQAWYAILVALLQAGADANRPRGSDGHTPMHQALRHGLVPVFHLLLAHGADPMAPCNGRSALHLSTHPALTAWLLDHGADPTAVADGRTPLEQARVNATALLAHEALHAQQRAAMGLPALDRPSQAEQAVAVHQVLETFALRTTLQATAPTVEADSAPTRASARPRL